MADLPRILFVDDDPQILNGFKLNLRKACAITTATSGAEALALLPGDSPFSVIVSDMRMPGMTGAVFLAEARKKSPNSVRILLTGQSDIESTVAAVNDGQIFRFLVKPCPVPDLLATLAEADRQHCLLVAEKELLEKTLHGAVAALTDVLAVVQPAAFGRAHRVKKLAALMAAQLDLVDRWPVEVAAMLWSIGFVSLPPATSDKALSGRGALDSEEKSMVKRVPTVTKQILANIPRLEPVIALIEEAAKLDEQIEANAPSAAIISPAGRALRIALDFVKLEGGERTRTETLQILTARAKIYGITVFEILAPCLAALDNAPTKVHSLSLAELRPGMILHAELKTRTGILLAPKGQELSAGSLARISNFARTAGVQEPLLVLVPV